MKIDSTSSVVGGAETAAAFFRRCDFTDPADLTWEDCSGPHGRFEVRLGRAKLTHVGEGRAEIYLRPCHQPGDELEWRLTPGAPRAGTFVFGASAGFEYIRVHIDWDAKRLEIFTHEFHKRQPRLATPIDPAFNRVRFVREEDALPGLPYPGARVTVLLDDQPAITLPAIDFLHESWVMFGVEGTGEVSLESWSVRGRARPRPESLHVGAWQQSIRNSTVENVDALIEGVRQAARAGVQVLVTPETSLTGLRVGDPELDDERLIQEQLRRFREQVAAIPSAPYTLVGYPEWVSGREVEGSDLERVRVNAHRFVRPDGTLGPRMAKVHSCEEGFWHGRRYNVQRVAGAEVAVGVCHDGRYQDVFAVGVMAGARLCLHPVGAGRQVVGRIDDLVRGMDNPGNKLEAFWVRVNVTGPTAIFHPFAHSKTRQALLAIGDDYSPRNPTYPDYSPMGDLLVHANIRLWDATGSYPMRTLRNGSAAYRVWSQLVPPIQDV